MAILKEIFRKNKVISESLSFSLEKEEETIFETGVIRK